jgi:hypothetical protein
MAPGARSSRMRIARRFRARAGDCLGSSGAVAENGTAPS